MESMVVIDSNEFVQILDTAINHLTNESLLVGENYIYEENPLFEERKVSKGKGMISILRVAALSV